MTCNNILNNNDRKYFAIQQYLQYNSIIANTQTRVLLVFAYT